MRSIPSIKYDRFFNIIFSYTVPKKNETREFMERNICSLHIPISNIYPYIHKRHKYRLWDKKMYETLFTFMQKIMQIFLFLFSHFRVWYLRSNALEWIVLSEWLCFELSIFPNRVRFMQNIMSNKIFTGSFKSRDFSYI